MTDTASGAIATFESEYALPLRDLEIEINAVQESGTPTPSSPKAISGFTGANIKVAGKNLINITDCLNDYYVKSSDLSVSSIAGANVFYCDVPKNTDLVLTPDKSNRCVILGYKTRPSTIAGSIGDELIVDSPVGITSRSFNTGNNQFLAIYVNRDSANKPTQIMLEVGTVASAYQAYNSTTAAITWQTEAGTVYGGSLDVTSGVLTVTHAIVDMGSFSWNNASGNLSSSSGIASDVKAPSANTQAFNGLCSCYEVAPRTGIADKQISVQTNGNIVISDTAIAGMTGEQVKAYVNGFILVYELATPVTYQLTPTQISAIVGTNNVFTDTNGDTSLEYYAGHGAETAQVAEEIAADYTAKVVKTKNGIFANLLKSPLNSVWLICCQKATTAGSGFVGIYSFDGVNLNPCVVYIDGMSASFDSATGTITVKYGGSTTDVYGSAFRLA